MRSPDPELPARDGKSHPPLADRRREPSDADHPEPSLLPDAVVAEREQLLASERAAREAAESAQSEAEAANRAKSEFLAVMSHEIRTPINAIRGYAQLLEIGIGGPVTPQQEDYIARLTASADHLLGIVTDVLDLAQIETGRITVGSEHLMTGAAVAAALNLTRPLATARGIHVSEEREGEQGEPYVGDEHRVRQILVNLLSNAIKFTPPGGRVQISCALETEATPRGAPMVCIEVRDTGIGIAPDQLVRIFEPFHQAVEARVSVYTRPTGGAGLGLSISRRLARMMGGELTVQSEPGVGSSFSLWIPTAAEDSLVAGDSAPQGSSALADTGAPLATASEAGRRTGAGTARSAVPLAEEGLSALGDLLRDSMEPILNAYVRRVREDPVIPRARYLNRIQIEDHQASLVSDLAQALVIVAEAGADAAALLSDGSAIQRTIAENHGRRRRLQGWTEEALHRDHAILRDEMVRVLEERVAAGGLTSTSEGGAAAGPALDRQARSALGPALSVLVSLVRRAEAVSIGAWQRAVD